MQKSYLLECPPAIAFDCAIKTLQTFQLDGKMHINHRFMTVTSTFIYRIPSLEALASIKILSASIEPTENGCSRMYLTVDYPPAKAYNKGTILLAIAEYLDRYSQMLDQLMSHGNV